MKRSFYKSFCVSIIIILILNIVLGVKISDAATTGNTVYISKARDSQKIGSFHTYRKSGVHTLDLYCAQKGGSIDSWNNYIYNEHYWDTNAGIWAGSSRATNAYEKITWIKNNFWEQNSASSSNKYTTVQKVKFLQQADSSITETDVTNVFNSSSEKFKLYQMITWTYTNGRESAPVNWLTGSTKKIYNAIIKLANANYSKHSTQGKVKIEQTSEITDNGNGTYTWGVKITNTCAYPITTEEMILTIDGEKHTDFSYSNNILTINNISTGTHVFSFSASSYQVSSTASIWKNSSKQDMLEVTSTTKKKETGTLTTEGGTDGYYSLQIKKVSEDETTPLEGAEFIVDGITDPLETDSNGLANIESNKKIEKSDLKYSYTITEVNAGDKHLKLVNPVTINLISGVKKSDNKVIYAITRAEFEESGTSNLESKSEDGTIVNLSLELVTNGDTTTVTLKIQNKKKVYDLALTKALVIPDSDLQQKFDINFDGILSASDVSLIMAFPTENSVNTYDKYSNKAIDNGQYYIEDEVVAEAVELLGIDNDYAKNILGFLRNDIKSEYAREVYNLFDATSVIEKFMMLDTDYDKHVSFSEASSDLLTLYANIGVGNTIDRRNYVSSYKLNTSEDNKTAIYNLDKSTYEIRKSDILTYKITVYNEGNYDGKDIEITDYLPEGLVVCDSEGNAVTEGTVTCKINGREQIWNVEGNKATTTISDTLEAYDGKTLDEYYVYINCKLKESANVGDVLYNVAEISKSTPLDSEGNPLTDIQDRDSDENSLNTETNITEKYRENFTNKVLEEDSFSVNKEEYNYQDDDDFERVVIVEDSQFDLSLRKSITKIGNSESTMEEYVKEVEEDDGNIVEENRLPKLTEQSVTACTQRGTGEYYHGKEVIKIGNDDYVEYTIRVYNEGSKDDLSGYAKQITDYLPEGLEFYAIVDADGKWITTETNGKYVTTSNNFGYYEATYDETSNKLIIDCVDTPAILIKNNLALVECIDEEKIQSYYNNPETINVYAYCYQEVKIICKVSTNANVNTNLTNIAEITSSIAVDEEGNEVTQISDKDSDEKSITISDVTNTDAQEVNLVTYYEDIGVDDTYNTYYPGIEDDDDFETVKIEILPGIFTFKLVKQDDESTKLNDAKFEVTIQDEDGIYLYDGEAAIYQKEYTTANVNGEDGVISINGLEITDAAKTYTITLKEIEAPEGYVKLSNPIVFTATSEINGSYFTLKKEDNTSDINNVAESIVITNDSIEVLAENKKVVVEGEYNVNLVKKGIDGTQLGGVKFTAKAVINGAAEKVLNAETNPLTTNATAAVAVGSTVTIDKDKVGTPDVYTLKEFDIGNNEGYYIGITQDIVLTVNKKSETSSDGSTITNSVSGISLALDGATVNKESETKSTATLANGAKVTVELVGSTITITVENPEQTESGTYNVNLVKKGTDGTQLGGVKFTAKAVINGAAEKVLNAETNPLTTNATASVAVGSTVTIDKNKVGTPDVYTLKEFDIGDNEGYYIGITQDIVLTVNKTSETSTDGSTITNSVSGISLTLDGASITKESDTKSIATLTVNGEEVEVIAELKDSTITITVENPIVTKEGSYDVKLVKKGTDGEQLEGVEFTVKAQINGAAEEHLYTEEEPLVTSKTTAVSVGNAVTIDKDNINTPDKYTFKEINLGGNKGYYIGITQDIVITVNKKYEQSDDGSKIINSVKSIELALEGADITRVSDTKSIAKITVDGKELEVIAELNGSTITLTVEDPQVTGKFDLDLIKYVSGTTIPLSGAEFSIEIKDENQKVIKSNTDRYTTGEDGHLTEKITEIDIEDENKTYTITIQETKVPEGYKGINGSITFTATSKLSEDGKYYELVPLTSTTIENAKEVTITKDEILIKAENTPEGPHKGVKEVENQDSGYYGDETQEWVIQTLIPSDINKYGKYIITDKIDDRLVFSGIDNVIVKVLDGDTLTKDTDYQVTYDETSRTLKISFIEGNFVAGKSLTPGDTIEIRFNATFALDDDGNIIALNQSVPNQAILTYGNNSGEEVSLVTEIPEVHTGWAGVYKYDENTGVALEGAKFKIATSKENAEAGVFVKDANGKDLVAESNKQGIAIFTGLEFGEDAMDDAKYLTTDEITGAQVYKYNWAEVETKYYIVEIEAPEGFNEIDYVIEVVAKKDQNDLIEIEDLVSIANKKSIYDLALRKFITAVDGVALTGEKSREPDVDLANLIDETSTTATYTHPKDPVLVANGQIVTYTLRVYNEGPEDAYASLIKDDIPEGLEFVPYTEGDGSINDKYGWKLVDENDNEVTDISKAKYIVTNYFAKDNQELNLIKGFNKDTMNELDSREVQVQFRVTEPNTSDRIITNYAQISEETNKKGTPVTDRDSTPNEWKDEDDEDIEQVKVLYFDLALRKWVTQAIVIENGQTVVTETGHKAEDDPEDVVKVDLKKSKIDDVTVKFKYSIRITNEGEIAGEAEEISDYIPEGLKFVAEDNPDWKEVDGKVTTDKLDGVTLEPGESSEVEIILTWINDESNMGVMVNTAEISKDYNKYGTPDIDSTPNNKVPKEDDIDDAPVMLTVTTGQTTIMIMSLALFVVAIIGTGVTLIKKHV